MIDFKSSFDSMLLLRPQQHFQNLGRSTLLFSRYHGNGKSSSNIVSLPMNRLINGRLLSTGGTIPLLRKRVSPSLLCDHVRSSRPLLCAILRFSSFMPHPTSSIRYQTRAIVYSPCRSRSKAARASSFPGYEKHRTYYWRRARSE